MTAQQIADVALTGAWVLAGLAWFAAGTFRLMNVGQEYLHRRTMRRLEQETTETNQHTAQLEQETQLALSAAVFDARLTASLELNQSLNKVIVGTNIAGKA